MNVSPGTHRFAFATWLFLRLLGIVHLCAFVLLWIQLPGLIGPHGILPAGDFLRAAHEQLGPAAFARVPTLAWLTGAGAGLQVLCAAGSLLSLLLIVGIAPAACAALLWIAYLSLVNVGQIFLGFQWDALLLETTLLAVFLAPWSFRAGWPPVEPPPLSRALLLWLLLRLMFLSGLVKLTSGDPNWRDLTALTFHFQTQPLPTPLAWWAHRLPEWSLRTMCALMFAIELAAPWLLFAPRPWRHGAALSLILLQVVIALTGNYAFFNLLTVSLCVLALDDAWWARLLPRRIHPLITQPAPVGSVRLVPRGLLLAAAIFVIGYTALLALPDFDRGRPPPVWFAALQSAVAPFASFNNYGLFAVMTTSRPELVIQGSDDGRDWRSYELPHKPGDPARRPDFVAPHQPRLDWQLWFAALGSPGDNPWVLSLCGQLLRGTPEVLALFARNPFPDKPPRYVRVVRYDYTFSTAPERARTGRWWERTPTDFYVRPVSLR